MSIRHVLIMRKSRLKEVNFLALGHKAAKWQSNRNPRPASLFTELLSPPCLYYQLESPNLGGGETCVTWYWSSKCVVQAEVSAGWRAWESVDTARRRLITSQKVGSPQMPNLLALWSWTCQLPELWGGKTLVDQVKKKNRKMCWSNVWVSTS